MMRKILFKGSAIVDSMDNQELADELMEVISRYGKGLKLETLSVKNSKVKAEGL